MFSFVLFTNLINWITGGFYQWQDHLKAIHLATMVHRQEASVQAALVTQAGRANYILWSKDQLWLPCKTTFWQVLALYWKSEREVLEVKRYHYYYYYYHLQVLVKLYHPYDWVRAYMYWWLQQSYAIICPYQ